ncbi:flavin reductase [Microbispora sp. H10836]|uniref:flavin reductase n=1 Tax=Microbispora sp. H10836 TaxID=2729106 RepID=UPI001474EAB2|nr:flavin reductase [Microbispora sp. H10836]
MTRPDDIQLEHMPTPVDPVVFRRVVGHLASGVTIVTTSHGSDMYGMTASSVTSLSLEPPLMLACINNAAPTASAVSQAGHYAVNVLGEGSAHLAQQFAGPHRDKFRGVDIVPGALGAPVLSAALANLECRVVERVRGGTHTIFIGEVVAASAREGSPLTYFRGGFGRFEFERDDEAYRRARRLLLERRYGADTVLSLDEFAYDLDVDKASAFYALTRLAVDQLVRRDPERGYVVAPFDVRTSDEAFDARSAIEAGVIDMTAGRLTPADLGGLRERFETMATLLVGDHFIDFDRYVDANLSFHEYLVSLAGNAALSAAFGQIGLRAVMVRSFGASPLTSQAFIEVQRELTEALEAADTAAAKRAAFAYTELAKARAREILAETGGML